MAMFIWKQLCLMMINDIQSEEMVFGAIQEKSVAYYLINFPGFHSST